MPINKTVITFDLKLRSGQVRQFRGAIDEKIRTTVGDNDLFHNHDNATGRLPQKYLHRYPLIQYQEQLKSKRAQIVGLAEGSDALLSAFLDHYDGYLNMNKRTLKMKVHDLQQEQIEIKVTPTRQHYHLQNWLPLREKYLAEWQKIDRLTERIQFLERLLANNIIAMVRGLDIRLEKKFELYLTWLADEPKIVHYKRKKQLAFQAQWAGNIQLPSYIGLGRGASEGFGRLMPLEG